ncbi:MAG TPA: hypothetical protein DC054_04760 [Blastocatellia bacterium]|nr:hypothetical protein [Blastocatellia bacterium]
MTIQMTTADAGLKGVTAERFLSAVSDREPVSGLTHTFYRYPARFSPAFARTAIELFTDAGDLVFDGFMGGATSLVEARVLGRKSIGTDVSELAAFVGRVKTTSLSDCDLERIAKWGNSLSETLNLHHTASRARKWISEGYQRNINTFETWRIRKSLELALSRINELETMAQQEFARCALLNCGQWALDCRTTIPTSREFRVKLQSIFTEMIAGAREYARVAQQVDTLCIHRSVIGVEKDVTIAAQGAPRLILLSPPYPGVYVLYHRWKVQGRRETPAPFWIANSLDGSGMAYYTLGDRKQQKLRRYFAEIKQAFTSLAKVANDDSWVVQMVGFSNPSWQLPKYLKTLEQAGLTEIKFSDLANSRDGRLWRNVPNRKWFAAYQHTAQSTAREVVLFHKLLR